MSSMNTTDIPVRLITKADLSVGDILVFRPLEDIKKLDGAKVLTYGWDDAMVGLLEKEYVVTQEMLDYAGERIDRVEIDGWLYSVGISMLKLKDDKISDEDKEEKDEPMSIDSNIRSVKKDQAIIDKMKSLVDKKRLKILLSISSSDPGNVNMVTNEMVETYLNLWANAKYDIFRLFGEQLTLRHDVVVEVDDNEVREKLSGLCEEYPIYGLLIEQFNLDE